MKIRIDDILVNGRHRRDMGDVDSLAASIGAVGLLHPVVLTADYRLIAGERRLAAARSLGWKEVPAVVAENVTDAVALLTAERDENTCRKDFAPSEAVAVGRALEDLERPKAEERKREGQKSGGRGNKKLTGNLPTSNGKARTHDAVAAAIGMGRRTYEKAKAVVDAAAAEPERFKAVKEDMDRTDNVDKAFHAMRRANKQKEREEAAGRAAKVIGGDDQSVKVSDFRKLEIPDGSVDLIFTDPPYDRKTLPLYGDLAAMAARVLAPGGSLICYLGQYQIHEVCKLVTPHLRLWWTLACVHTGTSARMTEYGIVVKWKPMLWFVRDTRGDKETFVDDAVFSERQKDAHEWQQGLIEARYYIDRLTIPGQMVFDPFCGGGTTACAAKELRRRWLTCDVDETAARLARKRVHDTAI